MEKRQLGRFLWISEDQHLAVDPMLFIHLSPQTMERLIRDHKKAIELDPSLQISRTFIKEMNEVVEQSFVLFLSFVEEQLKNMEKEKEKNG